MVSITATVNFSTFFLFIFFSMAIPTESSSSTILRSSSRESFRINDASVSKLPVKRWYFDLNARCAVRMSLMRSMTWAFLAFISCSKRIGVEIWS